MLAYVFWHVPRPAVTAWEYESAHQSFCDVLWQSRVPGLVGLRVHALPSIPWLGGASGYEDWHLLEDSAALDRLNEAAVTHARQLPHDRIAALAAAGTAGLYALRAGASIAARIACWLTKPSGMSYSDFDRSLQPFIERGACLWGRRMTLGPTPEFCLQSVDELTLPIHFDAIRMEAKFSRP